MGLGRFIPQKLNAAIMQGLGLCTAYLGIIGFSSKTHPLMLIIAMVLGIAIGELIDLDAWLNRLGEYLKAKFSRNTAPNITESAEGETAQNQAPAQAKAATGAEEAPPAQHRAGFSEGFVTATLLWCTGAMVVVGCIQDGMQGDPRTLYAKSALDFVSSVMFASSLGIGVLAASVSVLVIQGGLTLAAAWIAPLLSEAVIADISCVGSVLLFALSLNILGITKLKVMNFTPACIMPILLHMCGLPALLS